ncbi:MAG: LPP20 family lipoprotein [Marinilabiliaceae bacterium]|nr:LPP20 family lipoprotein [Marinilabiliaceae bacterium]
MNRILRYLILAALLQCQYVFVDAKTPQWVKQRPVDNQHYIGIGMSLKSDKDYAQTARKKALVELGSEIKITVSSNSLLQRMEQNYHYQEEYISSVHSSVMQTLEGYETETWEDKKEYWVMVKLNKVKYETRQKQKLDQAKMMASLYFERGREAADKGEVGTAIISYFKAVSALRDHIGDDLTHRTAAGTVNYSVDIMTDLQKLYRKTEFKTDKSVCQFEFSKQSLDPLKLQAIFVSNTQEIPIQNLPVRFEFTQGEGVLAPQSTTDYDGFVQCVVSRLTSKRKHQEVTASLDLAALLTGENIDDILLRHFLPGDDLPKTRFIIEMNKPTAIIEIEEIVFGKKENAMIFGNLIKSELNENVFNFTNNRDNADYIVRLKLEFRKGEEKKGSGYSVYLVHADLHLSVISTANKTMIFSDGFLEVRGMLPGSYEQALKDAREKTLEKFKSEILIKLEEVDI